MNKKGFVSLALVCISLFSCSTKSNVVYIDKHKLSDRYLSVSQKTKKEIEKIVSNDVLLPKEKTKKISKIVKKEKIKTAKIVKKKVEKKYKSILTPYTKEKIKKKTMLLRQPITPIKEPDVILRVLLLPYVDDKNVFHSGEYIFVKVEEGKWILGDYIKRNLDKKIKEYNPLKEEKQ